MDNSIEIKGLREFSRQLRKLDNDLPKGLRLIGNDAANVVVDKARPLIPRLTGAAAGSLKAKSTRTAARVSAGGRKVPYYGWLDFGGRVGRHNSVSRPFMKEGRYIWKTFSEERTKVQDVMEKGLKQLAERAGLEPR